MELVGGWPDEEWALAMGHRGQLIYEGREVLRRIPADERAELAEDLPDARDSDDEHPSEGEEVGWSSEGSGGGAKFRVIEFPVLPDACSSVLYCFSFPPRWGGVAGVAQAGLVAKQSIPFMSCCFPSLFRHPLPPPSPHQPSSPSSPRHKRDVPVEDERLPRGAARATRGGRVRRTQRGGSSSSEEGGGAGDSADEVPGDGDNDSDNSELVVDMDEEEEEDGDKDESTNEEEDEDRLHRGDETPAPRRPAGSFGLLGRGRRRFAPRPTAPEAPATAASAAAAAPETKAKTTATSPGTAATSAASSGASPRRPPTVPLPPPPLPAITLGSALPWDATCLFATRIATPSAAAPAPAALTLRMAHAVLARDEAEEAEAGEAGKSAAVSAPGAATKAVAESMEGEKAAEQVGASAAVAAAVVADAAQQPSEATAAPLPAVLPQLPSAPSLQLPPVVPAAPTAGAAPVEIHAEQKPGADAATAPAALKMAEVPVFDTVESLSDHAFRDYPVCSDDIGGGGPTSSRALRQRLFFVRLCRGCCEGCAQASRVPPAVVRREWAQLRQGLHPSSPGAAPSIIVRASEQRMDHLRALIIGPSRTPYEDGVCATARPEVGEKEKGKGERHAKGGNQRQCAGE